MRSNMAPLTGGFFHGLAMCDIDEEPEGLACHEINNAMDRADAALPAASVLVVYTGNRSFWRLREESEPDGSKCPLAEHPVRKEEFKHCRQGLIWVMAKIGD
jgi:hypothetical protein